MTLSIIIPIYNVADSLRRCVDSVLAQFISNFELLQFISDFELLLVDDGSTDESGLIADEYAAKYACVRCFHKPNGGLSDARNFGLQHAVGRYVTFVDSDDEVAAKTYIQMLQTLGGPAEYDIIEFPMLQKPGLPDETLFLPGEHIFRDALDWLAYKGTEHCWVCNKIFKRRLFDNVRFPIGKKFEDMLTHIELIKQRPCIVTVNYGCYIYHYNAEGIAAKDKANGLTSLLEAQLTLVRELGIDTRQRRWHRLYMNMLTAQLYTFRRTETILLKPQRIVLWGYATWKDSLKALLVDTIGLRMTCRLFKSLSR
ncbi:glycosyltransferase family 2 protein [Leyella stercorea]|uniref:glycosyltransferase family 2 protein n=1 Tax=Leyella stercorea TaxID=363265 RepID=UPI00242C2F81|nr:glycosyltransferase [Leyella stercorea]